MQNESARVFLGWDRPLPELAADRLFGLFGNGDPPDLSGLLILTPTAEAGRLLREKLASDADSKKNAGITGLDIRMPDQLFADIPAANAAMVLAAWYRTLKSVPSEEFRILFGKGLDETRRDAARLLSISGLIQNCRRTLAEDGVSLAEAAEKIGGSPFAEQAARFELLHKLEEIFLRICPDDPVRRMLSAAPSPGDTRTVIVLHCPDLRGAAARFLDRRQGKVEYWIHAPETMRDRFDRQGRALPVWREVPFEIDPVRQVRIAAKPEEQVDALEELRRRGLPCRAVGVLDQEVSEAWQDRLRRSPAAEMPIFFPSMRPLSDMPWTQAFRLLKALRGDDPTCAEIAALLHHGLLADRKTLAELDRLQKASIAQDFDTLLHEAGKDPDSVLFKALTRIRNWRRRIRAAQTGHLSVCWDILREIGSGLPPGRIDAHAAETELAALEAVITGAEQAASVNPAPEEAIAEYLIGMTQMRPTPSGSETLDAVGFLELGWYGDRTVIVAGFSEEAMGYGSLSDAFLPEQAKEILGIRTVAECQAADAFRFTALQQSAELRFLVGRFSTNGDTLRLPSILMQCGENELPARIMLLFGPRLVLPGKARREAPPGKLSPRRETPAERRLSVTDFKTYLSSPFGFYLQKILRAEKADDRHIELDPLQSGSLLHAAIAQCTDEMQTMASAENLFAAAAGHLHDLASQYGRTPPGLLAVQFQIMEENLRYFAEKQAARQAEGWRVILAEKKADETTLTCSWADFYHRVFPNAERAAWRETVEFKGRFDRLDARIREDGTRELCVIDYKTGKAMSPAAKHFTASIREPSADELDYRAAPGRGFWQDLQLPLYILMIRHLLPGERADRIGAAYFNLPVAFTSTGIAEFSELNEDLLDSAMRCADAVACRICGPSPVFWPPRDIKNLFDPYAPPDAEDFAENGFARETEP